MGSAQSAGRRQQKKESEAWVALEEARALAGNPYTTSARYHKGGERVLADDYRIHDTRLGEGMNGAVMLAAGHLDGQRYAVKRFVKQGLSMDQKKFLQREAQIHLVLDHPNVCKLYDLYESSEEVALVMECCAGGELFDRVIEKCRFSEAEAAVATRQMLSALGYLHAQNLVHRDVKLENFLYTSKDAEATLKLIDFGFARFWGPGMPEMRKTCGSVAYLSPDVLCEQGYTSKCDIWSLGVIVFILLSGYMPFSGHEDAMIDAIQQGQVNWRGKAWRTVSAEPFNFAKALLTFDPESRPDAKTALRHPWLARPASPAVPRLSKQVMLSIHEYAGASKLRRAALQLLARELLPEEAQELGRLFLGLDQSESGTVSLRDFEDAICEFQREQADPWSTPEHGFHRSLSSVSTADTDLADWSPLSSSGSLSPAGSDTTRAGAAQAPARLQWGQGGAAPLSSAALAGADGGAHLASVRLQWGQKGLEADLRRAGELFHALDVNGDGKVCFSDFVAAALGSQPQLREQAVQRAFARLDVDRSGSVGAGDLRRALGGPFEGAEPPALLASAGVLLDAHGEVGPRAFASLLRA